MRTNLEETKKDWNRMREQKGDFYFRHCLMRIMWVCVCVCSSLKWYPKWTNIDKISMGKSKQNRKTKTKKNWQVKLIGDYHYVWSTSTKQDQSILGNEKARKVWNCWLPFFLVHNYIWIKMGDCPADTLEIIYLNSRRMTRSSSERLTHPSPPTHKQSMIITRFGVFILDWPKVIHVNKYFFPRALPLFISHRRSISSSSFLVLFFHNLFSVPFPSVYSFSA